ncbi:diguanylate cyclase domain-containing protein [Thioalkalivibrio denitrificans]|uniref:diguanylate cyclase domain-containing protein n=1 Tax=Thioalkalivibrio denitrificans TaxID=108003 RepID=UPI0011159128|nr:diguanylate cyclase [Thioalkalivibrio denitrificans]
MGTATRGLTEQSGKAHEFRQVNVAAFVGLAVILLATVALAGLQLRGVYQGLEEVVNHHNLKTAIATEMQVAGLVRTESLYRMLLLDDPFERDAMLMRHYTGGYRVGAARQRLLDFPMDTDERRLYDEQGELIERVVAAQEQVVELMAYERMDEARVLTLEEAMPLQAAVHGTFEAMRQQQAAKTETAMQLAGEAYTRTLWLLIIAGVVALVGSLIIAVLAYRRTRHIALHDPLTGLLTRAGFIDAVQREIEQRRRSGGAFAVLVIDLDHFKPINDRYGHAEGDAVLQCVAGRLRLSMRKGDIVARLGGDEFAVVVRDVREPADCRVVADKIARIFAGPIVVGPREHRLDASIGRARYPEDALTVDELVAVADQVMYEHKHRRREAHGEAGVTDPQTTTGPAG